MIRKSAKRFSEKIMLKQQPEARRRPKVAMLQAQARATVLFHPDFNRRLRNCTESADPSFLTGKALAGLGLNRLLDLRPLPPVGTFTPP
jgi:hypothetical protein